MHGSFMSWFTTLDLLYSPFWATVDTVQTHAEHARAHRDREAKCTMGGAELGRCGRSHDSKPQEALMPT